MIEYIGDIAYDCWLDSFCHDISLDYFSRFITSGLIEKYFSIEDLNKFTKTSLDKAIMANDYALLVDNKANAESML